MEEYIKRKDALDVFSKYMFAGYRGNGKSSFSEIIAPTIYRAIEDLPSANVRENKYGEWLNNYRILELPFECSVCGEGNYEESSFCPHCGAEMRGEING